MKTSALAALSFGIVSLSASYASAAPITWTLSSASCTGAGSLDGNSRTCGGSGVGSPPTTATAWSNTQGSSNVNLENALLEIFSGGLGVRNRDRTTALGDSGEASSPQHAIDNENRYDSVLLSFTGFVALNQVRLGYWSGDSDITVMAYLGGGPPLLAGNSYASLVGLGWNLVGHYANLNYQSPINAGSISSPYWLISAYNPTVGGGQGHGLSPGNDHVKLYSVSGESQPVPEPASLALLGSGLIFAAAARRRARRQAK